MNIEETRRNCGEVLNQMREWLGRFKALVPGQSGDVRHLTVFKINANPL